MDTHSEIAIGSWEHTAVVRATAAVLLAGDLRRDAAALEAPETAAIDREFALAQAALEAAIGHARRVLAADDREDAGEEQAAAWVSASEAATHAARIFRMVALPFGDEAAL